MTKQEILDYFKDINYVYNDCGKMDSLSYMLDELLKEQDKRINMKQRRIDQLCKQLTDLKHRFHEKTELVRCKDCIYWQDNNDGYPHIGCKWREDETPDPDDFCSAGERREE